MHAFHVILHPDAANIVGLGPTAIIVGTNIDETDVEFAFNRGGNLVGTDLFTFGGSLGLFAFFHGCGLTTAGGEAHTKD